MQKGRPWGLPFCIEGIQLSLLPLFKDFLGLFAVGLWRIIDTFLHLFPRFILATNLPKYFAELIMMARSRRKELLVGNTLLEFRNGLFVFAFLGVNAANSLSEIRFAIVCS